MHIWKLLLGCETGKQISTNKNKEHNKPIQIKNEKKILWILVWRSARHFQPNYSKSLFITCSLHHTSPCVHNVFKTNLRSVAKCVSNCSIIYICESYPQALEGNNWFERERYYRRFTCSQSFSCQFPSQYQSLLKGKQRKKLAACDSPAGINALFSWSFQQVTFY